MPTSSERRPAAVMGMVERKEPIEVQGNLNELLKELPPDVARHVARYGVKLAIDLLHTLYADLSAEEAPAARKKLGRPKKALPKALPTVKLAKSGWPADPEERSREMKRRLAVAREKAKRAAMSEGAKKRWNEMSPARKKEWLASMQRGRQQSAKKEEAA